MWGKTFNRTTDEEEDLIRSRMSMTRVCIYHVNQSHISRAAAICGEVIATMCWECVRYEVDIMAGDGNKAAYYCTPKAPGVPTYECSLLQFWIDRMINTATQARIKQYGPSPKVRAKHFITCSNNDLVHLNHNLRGITTEKYTEESRRKLRAMVTVACSQCWNGDILAMTFLKMLMITMMRTAWSMKENFLFK